MPEYGPWQKANSRSFSAKFKDRSEAQSIALQLAKNPQGKEYKVGMSGDPNYPYEVYYRKKISAFSKLHTRYEQEYNRRRARRLRL